MFSGKYRWLFWVFMFLLECSCFKLGAGCCVLGVALHRCKFCLAAPLLKLQGRMV